MDGARSIEEEEKSGVSKGTVLGPLLFVLHTNDIVYAVDPSSECRLFANDCLLCLVIKSTEDQTTLQRDLDSLELLVSNGE